MSTARRLEEMLADSRLDPAEQAGLAELLAPLAATTDRAPEPSAALAALFGEAADADLDTVVPATRAVRRWRVRTAAAGAAVVAVASVGATGLSAAANTLPSVVQHHVSQFSRHYLPFDFPEPTKRTDQPLGHGQLDLAPHGTTLPSGGDGIPAAPDGAKVGVPRALAGAGHPSQAGPVPAPRPGRQDVRSASHPGYAEPSAAPSSAPSASPSEAPSALVSPGTSSGGQAVRTPSASPSPSSPGTAQPDKGGINASSGGHKPGKGEDPSTGTRPGKTPGKSPGKAPGKGAGGGSGGGAAPVKGVPGTGPDVIAGQPAVPPATPEPGSVIPELPGLGDLPSVPFAP